ncbi:1-deoxy-D-xylulose-5-phosphate reductoisomerase [Breoghania sp.]|uniref:1-deoxy-D-xylulose-5-phosphate reductoisomerase n=1 Tax=Breoghania sp. TaxID=2065378 RepID=UPI002609AC02|nr:1-deoxy-D-xylulose-5-phosphate reductoisomerase [Breoghania sp.]MDJ0929682.1 1-deoxy-D-xylulose-5-phosphate reductoisomerase [Breoghania sp.]
MSESLKAPLERRDEPLRLVVLGSTGSIGCSTVDLISRHLDAFEVVALVANRNVDRLAEQARSLGAKRAVVADPTYLAALRETLSGTDIEVAAGEVAVVEAAAMPADMVVAAIVGAAGLAPTLAAVRQGRAIALANKESLVCAGKLVMAEAKRHKATILPVDSEHNALFQVFEADNAGRVEKVILTASGGPFRTWSKAEIAAATPEVALRHPNWQMGARITIDSASMMNKGFELIEAFHLFPLPADRIDVLVHPQSTVHGLVQYCDGSLLAQLGAPDMRTPIAHCLAWPNRIQVLAARLDLANMGTLTFEKPDVDRFPALGLARAALAKGKGAPVLLNAADEIAVAAFLSQRIGFTDIVSISEQTIEAADRSGDLIEPDTLEVTLALDAVGRRLSRQAIENLATGTRAAAGGSR